MKKSAKNFKKRLYKLTLSRYNRFCAWGISSAGRVPHWQCGCQRFESAMLHQVKKETPNGVSFFTCFGSGGLEAPLRNRAGDAILEAGERMRGRLRSAKHKQAANPRRVRYAPRVKPWAKSDRHCRAMQEAAQPRAVVRENRWDDIIGHSYEWRQLAWLA